MAVYRTTFPIGASADTVWDVLTDFERYPEWNPSLPSISGELQPAASKTSEAFFLLFRAVMGSAIQRHHDTLNVALTERAEGRPASKAL